MLAVTKIVLQTNLFSGFTVRKFNDLPKTFIAFSERPISSSAMMNYGYRLLGFLLFPLYWFLAYLAQAPGLGFRKLCLKKGVSLLLQQCNFADAYRLMVFPLDSVRYFEFEFMWSSTRRVQAKSYLDVSSPRLLPLMIAAQDVNISVDLLNPDKNDLPITILLAKSFGVANRCTFYGDLIDEVQLETNSFDLITSMSVLEHIPDDRGAVKKMWDFLKPGGVLLLSVPCAAKASEEYTNLNDYELLDADEKGFVFWQRYYDEELIHERIYTITGMPRRFQVYGEKKDGSYNNNVAEKRSNPFYPYWREPLMMGMQYEFKEQLSELSGMGVIAMEFVKEDPRGKLKRERELRC